MNILRKAMLVYVTLALFIGGTFASAPAYAEFQAPGLNETLGSLSTSTSEDAVTRNADLLQAKLAEINNRIAAGGPAAEIAQLNAVSITLRGIIERIQQGLSLNSYSSTSDEATLESRIVLGFVDQDGHSSTFTVVVPSAYGTDSTGETPDDDTGYGDEDSGSSSSNADMVTQVLQQLASSLTNRGGFNPLGSIQGTLGNLTSPVQALTGMLTNPATAQAAASAMMCGPDGKPVAANGVAVYDSSTGNLYMPDGSVLKANSGNGRFMNDPSSSNLRNRGPIPTNVYTLSMRESLFHCIEAIRLNPTGSGNMYGRDGFLVHPPLRRGSLGSAGCIAIATQYQTFLNAFKQGLVKKVVVVASMKDAAKCQPPKVDTSSPQSLAI